MGSPSFRLEKGQQEQSQALQETGAESGSIRNWSGFQLDQSKPLTSSRENRHCVGERRGSMEEPRHIPRLEA